MLGIPKANKVFYLNLPLKISKKLIKKRLKKAYLNGSKKDIHEKDEKYLEKVRKMYLKLAKRKNWIRIDCYRNGDILKKEEIHGKIYSKIFK